MLIKEIRAEKILDSRGEPTIKVSVNGEEASAPSGKSVGKYETPSYHEDLGWNIDAINSLKFDFPIKSFSDLKKVENLICSKFKFRFAKQFGANALYALESAILKALAKSKNKELWQIVNENARIMPVPVGNAIGGGLHSVKFKVHPIFQEFLLIPKEKSFEKNVEVMNKIYNELGETIGTKLKNDEGAWQVTFNNDQVLQELEKYSNKIRIGLDVAASSFFKNGSYKYDDKILSPQEQRSYINHLINKYNILYVEDPLHQEDFDGFSKIVKKNLVVGDDLTATQIGRLKEAIDNKSINAMIIKPNQNGSLLELQKIFDLCKNKGIKTILSHRSGETMDSALADYAFGFQADFIKTGISTAWRQAKLQRMIEIEKSI